MAVLTTQQMATVKAKGFLRNRGTDYFSGRLVPAGCVFSAEDLRVAATIAEQFGNGKVAFTSRLTAEIVGIPYDQIDPAIAYAEAHGLTFGGTGTKVRPVTACKGTTCVFGNFDTQALAKTIHDTYCRGWNTVTLPHKFKIGVGGCPNSCMKPSLNDFGVEGHKIPTVEPFLCRGCKKCVVQETCPMKAVELQQGKAAYSHRNLHYLRRMCGALSF